MGDYRRLSVWRTAHELALEVYRCTRTWPKAEQFGIGEQLRRAAVSIGANIAEGCGRNGDAELRRFLNIALGSANELHFLLRFATDLGLLEGSVGDRLQAETLAVCRMLSALHRATRTGTSKRKAPGEAERSPI